MVEWIRRRERVEVVHHQYSFEARNYSGNGYSFDCTPEGAIVFNPEHEQTQRESLRIARINAAAGILREVGHVTWTSHYTEYAAIRCDCGAEVVLEDSMTNECDKCGQLYNGSAQRLAPPEQWDPEDRYAIFGPQNAPDDY
jgi:hypothetical protein